MAEPEKVMTATLSTENTDEEGKWQYTFESAGDIKLYKYSYYTNIPYEYYVVEENIDPKYEAELTNDGKNITNRLKTGEVKICKREGNTGEAMAGVTFEVTEPSGEVREFTTDENGVAVVSDLKYGVPYTFVEKHNPGYILKGGQAKVTLQNDGTPKIVPDLYPKIDPDGIPNSGDEGYLVENFEVPEPEKFVDGQKTKLLENYGDPVTYTIRVPLERVDDIRKLVVDDEVDSVMRVLPGSQQVYLDDNPDNDITNSVAIELDSTLRKVKFTVNGTSMRNYANRVLTFKFDARIATNPETLLEKYPDGSIPNKGSITINGDPRNRKETDEVFVNTEFFGATLQKRIETVDKGVFVNANANKKAKFKLVMKRGTGWDDEFLADDILDLSIGTFETDENGQIKLEKLGKGEYKFIETQAPANYIKGEPIEFTIDGSSENLSLTADNHRIELPDVDKMVKGVNENDRYNKHYHVPEWEDGFIYSVDLQVPTDPNARAKFTHLEFEDILPEGIEVRSNDDLSVELGTRTGNDFTPLENLPEAIVGLKPSIAGEVEVDGVMRQRLSLVTDNSAVLANVLGAWAGRTLRFNCIAYFKDGYRDISQFETDENGYIVNTAKVIVNQDFEKKSHARVAPPGEPPSMEKKVKDGDSWADHHTMGRQDETVTYEIRTHVDDRVPNYQNILITDAIPEVFDVQSVTAVAVDNPQEGESPAADIDLASAIANYGSFNDGTGDNNIRLEIDRNFEEIAGRDIVIRVKVKLKDNLTATQLAEYTSETPEGGAVEIPNTAKLTFNGGTPTDSTATVKLPPGEEPGIEKKVNNDLNSIDLQGLNDQFTYTVESRVDVNIDNYQSIILEDNLEDVLEAIDVSALAVDSADGVEDINLIENINEYGSFTNTNGQIKLEINKGFKSLAGKKLVLNIVAKVKDDATAAELAPYMTEGKIPNTASLKFNDGSPKTDTADVNLPQGPEPDIEKKVGPDADNVSRENFALDSLEDSFVYTIESTIDKNVNGYSSILIEDQVKSIFKVTNATAKVVGETPEDEIDLVANIAEYGEFSKGTTDNKVRLFINNESKLRDLAGKKIVVTVSAKVRDNPTAAQLKPYMADGIVPNTATLKFNGGEAKESTVNVELPEGSEPDIDKKVGPVAGPHSDAVHELEGLNDEFEFTIKSKLDKNVNGYRTIVIEDQLIDSLQVVSASAKAGSGSGEINLTGVTDYGVLETGVDDNLVKLTINDGFSDLADKEILITVRAKIKQDVTPAQLQEHLTEGKLPNTASLKFNDGQPKEDTVHVKIPDGDKPSVDKTVEGQKDFTLSSVNAEHTYTIVSKIDKNVEGYETVLLEDDLLDVLEVINISAKAGKGLGSDPDDIDLLENIADYGEFTHDTEASKVSLKLMNIDKPGFNSFRTLAGKTVVLTIDAKVRDDATAEELQAVMVEGALPNTAEMSFNGGSADTSKVSVEVPDGEKPNLQKKVGALDEEGNTEYLLPGLHDEYLYTIESQVNENVVGYNKLEITDQFESVLDINDISIVAEGETAEDRIDILANIGSYGTFEPGTDDNRLKLLITSGFDDLAGKKIVIKVRTKIKDDASAADLAPYMATGRLPNTADLNFNDSYYLDSMVNVKLPGGDKPDLVKTIKEQPAEEDYYSLPAVHDEYTYLIESQVDENILGYETILLEDTLKSVLQIQSVTAKAVSNNPEEEAIDLTNHPNVEFSDGATANYVKVKVVGDFEELAGRKIVVEIKTKIKDTATAEEISALLENGLLPNTATLKFNGGTPDESKANVKLPPGEEPTIDKTADEVKLLQIDNLHDNFVYKVRTKIDDNIEGYEKIELIDTLESILTADVIDVRAVKEGEPDIDIVERIGEFGNFSRVGNTARFIMTSGFEKLAGRTIEISFTTRIREDVTAEELAPYMETGIVPNTVTMKFNNGPEKNSSADVKIPKGPEPEIEKKVMDQAEYDLPALHDEFTYTIKTRIDKNNYGCETIVLEDELIDAFEVLGTTAVAGTGSQAISLNGVTEYGSLDTGVGNNRVKLTINNGFSDLADKDIVVTIRAKVKDDVSADQLQEHLVAGKLPNTASLSFNGGEPKNSTVHVKIPDGKKPSIDKKVEGKQEHTLTEIYEVHGYELKSKVDVNVEGYESIVIKDQLSPALEVVGTPRVMAGNIDITDNISQYGTFLDGSGDGLIKLDITKGFASLAGKTITISFNAKVKEALTVDQLEDYLVEDKLPNTVDLEFNGGEAESKHVNVKIPDGEKPNISKTVGLPGEPGEIQHAPEGLHDEFVYTIESQINENTFGYDSLVIEDHFKSILKIGEITVEAGDIDMLANIEDYGSFKDGHDDNHVKLTVDKGFADLAGRKIVIKVKAHVRENVSADDIAQYVESGVIPNTSNLIFNDTYKLDSTAIVNVPPGEEPGIEKKVNDLDEYMLTDKQEVFEYTLKSTLDKNSLGYESFLIEDRLKDVFEVRQVTAKAVSNNPGEADIDLTNRPGVEFSDGLADNYVKLKITSGFDELAGRQVVVKIKARVKSTATAADLANALEDNKIVNQVKLTFNGREKFDHADIGLPAGEKPTIDKKVKVRDSDEWADVHDLDQLHQPHTYKITSHVDDCVPNYKKIVISDNVPGDLELVGPVTARAVAEGSDPVDLSDLCTVEGNAITLTIAGNFDSLVGRDIEIIFDAKVKDSVDLDTVVLEDGAIKNTAKLTFTDRDDVVDRQSADAEVIPPGKEPDIEKRVQDGSEWKDSLQLDDLHQTHKYQIKSHVDENVKNYKKILITDDLPEAFEIKSLRAYAVKEGPAYDINLDNVLVKNGNQIKLELTDNFDVLAGRDIIIEIEAKVREGITLADIESHLTEGAIKNTAKLNFTNTSDSVVEKDDETNVIPPGENPTIEKKVKVRDSDEWEDAHNLDKLHQQHKYKLTSIIGENVATYKKIVIKDSIPSDLDIVGAITARAVKANATDIDLADKLSLEANTLTLTITDGFDDLAGREIEIIFDAKVKEGKTLESLTLVEGAIKNTADLEFTNKSDQVFESDDPAQVTPPGGEPNIEKKVKDGEAWKDSLQLTDLHQEHSYRIRSQIDENVNNYKKILITDNVPEDLDIIEVTAQASKQGAVAVDLSDKLTQTGNELKLEIEDGFDAIAGREIIITVKAKVKDSLSLDTLTLEEGLVKNTAKLKFTNTADEVVDKDDDASVRPPGKEPGIEKKVQGGKEFELADLNNEFTYTIESQVDPNVTNYNLIRIEDKVKSILDIQEVTAKAGDIDLVADIADYGSFSDGAGDNHVILKINKGFNNLAGKKIVVTIKAKVKDGASAADLAQYMTTGVIPNKATLEFNGGDPEESTADVKLPPGEEPGVDKTVEGGKIYSLPAVNSEHTYKIESQIDGNIQGYETIVIEDQLKDIFEVVEVTAKAGDIDLVENIASYGSLADGMADNHVKLTVDKGFADLAGKKLVVTIKAKIKDDATAAEIAAVTGDDGKIANDAGLTFNGGTPKKTTAKVDLPPGEEPGVDKTVEGGKTHTLTGLHDEFTYTIASQLDSNVEGYETIVLEDQLEGILEVVEVTAKAGDIDLAGNIASYGSLADGMADNHVKLTVDKGFTDLAGKKLVVTIKAKIRDDATAGELAPYIAAGDVENTAKLTFNGGTPKEDTAKVDLPPGDEPGIDKKVEGVKTHELTNLSDEFTYTIESQVDENVLGYQRIRIEDKVKSILDIQEVTAKAGDIDLVADIADYGSFSDGAEDNHVKLIVSKGFDNLAGKKIVVTIKAKISDDVSAAQLSKYVATGLIPNKATLEFNGGDPEESKADVKLPPGEEPGIDKKVNNEDEISLPGLRDEHTYTIKTKVDKNVFAYESILLEDSLVEVLEPVEVTARAGDIDLVADISDYGEFSDGSSDNKVKLNITSGFKNLAGKTITLTIKAKVRDDASPSDLSQYMDAGEIPNTAKLTFNSGEPKASTVKVKLPPGEEPDIDKKVEESTEHHLEGLHDIHTYTIASTIDSNVTGYESIVIEDKLSPALEVTEITAKAGDIDVAGDIANYGEFEDGSVDGRIKLTINDGFANLAGKKLVITVKAKVKDSVSFADIATYLEEGKLPNTAKLKFNDNPEVTSKVNVVPPTGNEPGIEKNVEGVKEHSLTGLHDEHTYTIESTIDSNTSGYSTVVLEDRLVDALEIVNVTAVAEDIDLISNIASYGDFSDGSADNHVKLTIDKGFANLAGKKIVVTIKAKVKDDVSVADLKPYFADGKIPNTAKLIFNGGEPKEDKVDVKIPEGDQPDIDKKVEGSDSYTLPDLHKLHTYTISSQIDSNVHGYESVVLEDQLADILEVDEVTVKAGDIDIKANIANYGSLADGSSDGHVKLTIDKNFADIAGRKLILTIKAKVKDSATEAELEPYIEAGKIQNNAKLTFNNSFISQSKVIVKPPVVTVRDFTVAKTWVGAKASEPKLASFTLYRKLEGETTGTKVTQDADGNPIGKISLTGDASDTWTNLPIKNNSGKTYIYYAEEDEIEGYSLEKESLSNGERFINTKKASDKHAVTLIKLEKGSSKTIEGVVFDLYRKHNVTLSSDADIKTREVKLRYLTDLIDAMGKEIRRSGNSIIIGTAAADAIEEDAPDIKDEEADAIEELLGDGANKPDKDPSEDGQAGGEAPDKPSGNDSVKSKPSGDDSQGNDQLQEEPQSKEQQEMNQGKDGEELDDPKDEKDSSIEKERSLEEVIEDLIELGVKKKFLNNVPRPDPVDLYVWARENEVEIPKELFDEYQELYIDYFIKNADNLPEVFTEAIEERRALLKDLEKEQDDKNANRVLTKSAKSGRRSAPEGYDRYKANLVTDKFGRINLELPKGEYYFKEVATVDGYVATDKLYKFVVDEDTGSSLITIEVENAKKPDGPKPPTPEEPKTPQGKEPPSYEPVPPITHVTGGGLGGPGRPKTGDPTNNMFLSIAVFALIGIGFLATGKKENNRSNSDGE